MMLPFAGVSEQKEALLFTTAVLLGIEFLFFIVKKRKGEGDGDDAIRSYSSLSARKPRRKRKK